MKVRRATYKDVAAILQFMEEYHPTSNLSHIEFDRRSASKMVDHCIGSRTCHPILYVEDDGTINGLLFGSLEPFFFNAKKFFATDIQFISNGHGMALLTEFKRWAKVSGAVDIVMGVSSGDPRADTFLELSGFTPVGKIHVLHLTNN